MIPSKLWAYAVLPEGELFFLFFHYRDSHKRQCYPWATSADKLDPAVSEHARFSISLGKGRELSITSVL